MASEIAHSWFFSVVGIALAVVVTVLSAASAAEPATRPGAVPSPQPVRTDYLVGAHYFPGWREGTHAGWAKIVPYPDRTPLLGYYDEGDPNVADWEIKWATEHGIGYFVYCWYRQDPSKPATLPLTDKMHWLGHALHEGLFRSRYGDRFRFAIMWENANAFGVSGREDLLGTLLPYWIRTYFRRDNYLKVDGKPVLFVYEPSKLIAALGSPEKLRDALGQMREACRKEDLGGLLVLGEYRGGDMRVIDRMRQAGFDAAFAYCWHTPQKRPTVEQAVAAQLGPMEARKKAGGLPFIATAGMGWDPLPWQDNRPNGSPWLHADKITRWRLTPKEFQSLLEKTKALMDSLPAGSLGRRMLLLDNWNEWGEGHYLAPHEAGGFGYLQAVREVFTARDNKPDYRTPKELGLGPYDSLYRAKVSSPATRASK